MTSCLLFLFFLCRFTCLPSNPVCLDSARLQPLQRNSGADWFVGPVVFFIPVQYFPINFSVKVPRWAWESVSLDPCLSSPTKESWPRIFPPPWSRYRFPAWGRSTQGWGRCMAKSCCWWRWVCGAGTAREAGGCQMAWSGGPDHVLGGAVWQKAETGTPAGIQSCRRACQHAAPPEETRGDHMTVSTAC